MLHFFVHENKPLSIIYLIDVHYKGLPLPPDLYNSL